MPLSQRSILIYGRDHRLLETRQWVFERTGAHVWTATQRAEFDKIAATVSIDLLVLCHSLSMEECGRALALAHTRWPEVQSLVLVWGGCGCRSGFSEQMADTAQGPAYLLHTVEKLLGNVHGNHSHAT